jgi:hypothetical protein
VSGAVWAAIQARQRAQFAEAPGVTLPSSREATAPVADGTLAGTPSTVSAASSPKPSALRASPGTPAASVRSRAGPPSSCSSSAQSRPLRDPPPLSRTRSMRAPRGKNRRTAPATH